MPMKAKDGSSEFIVACDYHANQIPSKLVEGEIIMISKMNETGRKVVHTLRCEYESEKDSNFTSCTNTGIFLIERGFPIQD